MTFDPYLTDVRVHGLTAEQIGDLAKIFTELTGRPATEASEWRRHRRGQYRLVFDPMKAPRIVRG